MMFFSLGLALPWAHQFHLAWLLLLFTSSQTFVFRRISHFWLFRCCCNVHWIHASLAFSITFIFYKVNDWWTLAAEIEFYLIELNCGAAVKFSWVLTVVYVLLVDRKNRTYPKKYIFILITFLNLVTLPQHAKTFIRPPPLFLIRPRMYVYRFFMLLFCVKKAYLLKKLCLKNSDPTNVLCINNQSVDLLKI